MVFLQKQKQVKSNPFLTTNSQKPFVFTSHRPLSATHYNNMISGPKVIVTDIVASGIKRPVTVHLKLVFIPAWLQCQRFSPKSAGFPFHKDAFARSIF